LTITHKDLVVEISDTTGSLASIRCHGQEFLIPAHDQLPLFAIQYLDERGVFHQADSREALRGVAETDGGYALEYDVPGSTGLSAAVVVRAEGRFVRWGLAVKNPKSFNITDIQFPWVVVRYDLGGVPKSGKLARPQWYGQLYEDIKPTDLEPDDPTVWQFRQEEGEASHYPGLTFAQFLAYYDGSDGLFVGCDDTGGGVKIIKPVHNRANGIRLGFAHVVGTNGNAVRLDYEVVMAAFNGDWRDAADIYRDDIVPMAGFQHVPLHRREDVPAWLLDSPMHTILRIQGEIDQGPAPVNPEFVPYENAVLLIKRLSERVDAPVLPILMSWEGPGPWVYPESFPPAGGADSLKGFTAAMRAMDFHVGTYCNGTRWITHHKWTGYDGVENFLNNGGLESACRFSDQELWQAPWDRDWRIGYLSCIHADKTRELARNYVETLLDFGFDWIQFFDQNVGCCAFPCYGTDHGHPPMPGPWMTKGMDRLVDAMHDLAGEAKRPIVYSVEAPPNEYNMPRFQTCDVRHHPQGHGIPLYQYLFHEYILTQGAFSLAPNPHWMEIKTVHSLTLGDIPSGLLGPGGRLMAIEGTPWALWDSPEGDQEAIFALLKGALALRRGAGKPWLVFGRLQKPANVEGAENRRWVYEGRAMDITTVFHSKWTDADGRVAIVLGNWTHDDQNLRITDAALPAHVNVTIVSPAGEEARTLPSASGTVEITLPGLGYALLTGECPAVTVAEGIE
jgi:hypothetical protein